MHSVHIQHRADSPSQALLIGMDHCSNVITLQKIDTGHKHPFFKGGKGKRNDVKEDYLKRQLLRLNAKTRNAARYCTAIKTDDGKHAVKTDDCKKYGQNCSIETMNEKQMYSTPPLRPVTLPPG